MSILCNKIFNTGNRVVEKNREDSMLRTAEMTPRMSSFVPGFHLIRYGKMTDMVTTAFERRVYYLQFSKEGANHAMQGPMRQFQGQSEGKRSEGKARAEALWCFP